MIKKQKITRKKYIYWKKAMALFIFFYTFYFQYLNAQLYSKENLIIFIQDSTYISSFNIEQKETVEIYIERETLLFSDWQYFKNTCKIYIAKQESLKKINKITILKNEKKSEKKNIIKKNKGFQKKTFIAKINPSILKLSELTHHLVCLNNTQQQKLFIQIHNESSFIKKKDNLQYLIIHHKKEIQQISVNSLSIRPPPI